MDEACLACNSLNCNNLKVLYVMRRPRAEVTEKVHAVPPEQAYWWTQNYDMIPPIGILEAHTISGVIIPLSQRVKTNEDARLRVVRVITEDQQRIVG